MDENAYSTAIDRCGRPPFYRDGFRSVGIDQILADVGISKTAFYKHFECKEDLMLAALEDHHRVMQETFHGMVRERGGPTPLGQLHALLDVVEHIVETDDFQGCIFVNAAMEFPLPHEPAHVAAAKNKQAIEDIVYSLAEEAGDAIPAAGQRVVPDHGGRLCYAARHREQADGRHRRRVAELVITSRCPQKTLGGST